MYHQSYQSIIAALVVYHITINIHVYVRCIAIPLYIVYGYGPLPKTKLDLVELETKSIKMVSCI